MKKCFVLYIHDEDFEDFEILAVFETREKLEKELPQIFPNILKQQNLLEDYKKQESDLTDLLKNNVLFVGDKFCFDIDEINMY